MGTAPKSLCVTVHPPVLVQPILRLVRIGNVVVSFAGTVVGGLAAAGLGLPIEASFWWAVLLAALSTACVTAAGNVLNDYLDIEGDRANHPDRPLVLGEITPRGAKQLAAGLFVAGGLLIVPIVVFVPWVGVIYVVAVLALLGYELRWKAEGFVGNSTVALLTGLVFLYGGAAAGDLLAVVPFAIMAFLATLAREITKDIEDMAGDVGRRTLPMSRGVPFSSAVARIAIGVAIAVSLTPLLWVVAPASVAGIMYLGLVLIADAVFVVSVAYLPQRLHWEQTVSKGAMAIALIAFLAVAFR